MEHVGASGSQEYQIAMPQESATPEQTFWCERILSVTGQGQVESLIGCDGCETCGGCG